MTSFMILGLFVSLSVTSLASMTTAPACSLLSSDQPAFKADGDFIIGGIFPLQYNMEMPDRNLTYKPAEVQCKGLNPRAFRWAQTMMLAVEEINQKQNLLPNSSLGYKIYSSCETRLTGQRAALAVLNGPGNDDTAVCSPLLALIGESGSAQSIVVSRTLQPFRIPMISYFSSCACLSNRQEHPTFFRVMPNDDYQVKAIAQLLQHYGWSWIGMVTDDNDYGKSAVRSLLREIKNTSVCLAYHQIIPAIYNRNKVLQILNVIKHSTAKVVVLFSFEGKMAPFIEDYMEHNITGIQWIASEAWVTASMFTGSAFYPFLGGTIGFGIRQGQIPGLRDYLRNVNPLKYSSNPLVHRLWGALYGCSFYPSSDRTQDSSQLPPCSGQENLPKQHSAYLNTSSPRVSYNVYKAVYAIAHALHNLIICKPGKGPFRKSTCADAKNIKPWQLQHYLQGVSFPVAGEVVKFDANGDVIPSYDMINWKRGTSGNIEFVNVGRFDGAMEPGKELFIKEDEIMWTGDQKEVLVSACSESCAPGSRKAVRRGEPLCCFDCAPCDSGKISNKTDSIECTSCPEDSWPNAARTACVPKVIEYLSYDAMGWTLTAIAILGASFTITVLAVLFYHRNTPIVKVNNSELSFFILLSLTLCFLCALLFIGKPTSWSCMLRRTAFSITFSLCISCILGKTLVVLAAFTATRPGNNIMKWMGPKQQRFIILACTFIQVIICVAWLVNAPPLPNKNIKYYQTRIILECSVGSSQAFGCVLGYIGLLAALCFILAFLARKLPGNFNEAKLITFSILIFCCVWLAFIPAYISSSGKFTVAVEIFAILASSYGLLVCLFVPKCYIILLKPEKNTKRHLMAKVT